MDGLLSSRVTFPVYSFPSDAVPGNVSNVRYPISPSDGIGCCVTSANDAVTVSQFSSVQVTS